MSDLISRQAAIDALCHVDEYNGRSIEAIRQLPSAQPEPKRGRWIETDKEEPCFYYCSECKAYADDETNYCPNCGAKMED